MKSVFEQVEDGIERGARIAFVADEPWDLQNVACHGTRSDVVGIQRPSLWGGRPGTRAPAPVDAR